MTGTPSRPGRQLRWAWWIGWGAIVVAGVVLKALQSTWYAFGTPNDDELMVRMAQGFLHGHWSSSWAQTGSNTLSKPLGYPLFLAGAHFVPWSPVFSAYLLGLVGAGLTAWSWHRISGSRAQATLILALLVFNPLAFTTENQRIYRDFFSDAITTLAVGVVSVIAAQIWLRQPPASGSGTSPAPDHRRSLVVSFLRRAVPYILAALTGLLLGFSAISKPTWMFLLPAVMAPLVYPIVRRIRRSPTRWRTSGRLVLAAAIFLVAGLGVVQATKYMNKRTYGVALTDDLSAGGLARTWKAWASVEAGPQEKYIVITKPMRDAVYRVSPAAAVLKNYLEPATDPWKQIDCNDPLTHICDDSGLWFEWDLQTAAVAAGQVHSVADFQTYFNKLADQISAACSRRELTCNSSPVLAIGLRPLDQIDLSRVTTDTVRGMWKMVGDTLPMSASPTTKPSSSTYRLWDSVVPAMPSIGAVTTTSTPSGLLSLFKVLDYLYRVANVVLLAVIALGLLLWALSRPLRRRWSFGRPVPAAAWPALLFLVSAVVGMGSLAVFEVGQGPGFISSVYWTDFITPLELFLAFGAISLWPVIAGPALDARRRATVAPAQSDEPSIALSSIPDDVGDTSSGIRN